MEIQSSKVDLPTTIRPAPPPFPPSPIDPSAEWRKANAEARRRSALGGCPPDLGAFAAGVSALTYHPFWKIETQLEGAGASDIQTFDRMGTQAVGFEREGVLWLAFRGSESSPERELFLDWGHDLYCLPWGWPPGHRGFARAWGSIRAPVLEWLAARPQGTGLILTGHSLGGALALTAANEIVKLGRAPIEAVLTFGAPRVGTWLWTRGFHARPGRASVSEEAPKSPPHKTLREVTWRFHNEGDIVTYLPPLIFAHCGKSVSASALRAATPSAPILSPFLPAAASLPESGFFGRIKHGYLGAKRALPYSPLTLFVDLILLLGESAPQHFIRHYAAAFPDRPFQEVGEPGPSLIKRTGLDKALAVVKWGIVLLILALVVFLAVLAYRWSAELAFTLLALTVVYSFADYVPVPSQKIVPPVFTPPHREG